MTDDTKPPAPAAEPAKKPAPVPPPATQPVGEIGGPAGPEPTRYGDWEQKGRCSDF
ncbi:MAG TPA: DUF1674 domain-containing protein [Azospirillaceae bacterium]|nr:DUF1674 domain-containing protein [Azospirillaceae bacterium]